VDGVKSYRFAVRWGGETTTDDTEGEITAQSDLRPSRAEIDAALPAFRGPIQQVPPQFSAIKVDGNRAYDLARDGEAVKLEAREVRIDSLEIVELPDADTAVFEAVCGKGTYVRSLARDLGRVLGCHGHVLTLRRTRVGPFHSENAWPLDKLRTLAGEGEIDSSLLPVENALTDLLHVPLSSPDAARIAQGQAVVLRGRDAPIVTGVAYVTCKGRLLALVEMTKGEIRPTRVFNLGV
ncbi:MAG TPA: tRNA pseudouridine(55) synthase TruB, partial [Hyphomicrobiaceae bacterium]|nr:tRNA pseudouridine(55) synthase TruB [Hyphomicrobiaceae bacterium]